MNDKWKDIWPHYVVSTLPKYKFDHNHIILDCLASLKPKGKKRKRQKLYHFE